MINDLSPPLSAREHEINLHSKPVRKVLPEIQDLTLTSLPKKASSTMSNKSLPSPPQSLLHEFKKIKSVHTPSSAAKSEPRFSMPYPESWEPKKGNEIPGYVMRIRASPDKRATEKAHSSQSSKRTKSPTTNDQSSCQPIKRTTECARKLIEQEKTQGILPSESKRIVQVRVDAKTQCPITTTNRAPTGHYRKEAVDKQAAHLADPPKPLVGSKHIALAPKHQTQESEDLIKEQAQQSSKPQCIEPTSNERLSASKKRKDISPPRPFMESKRLESSLIYRRQTSAERAEKGKQNFSGLQIQLPKTGDAYFLGNSQMRERTLDEGYRDKHDDTSLSNGIHKDRQRHANAEHTALHSKDNTQSYAARNRIQTSVTAVDSGREHSASSFQSDIRNSVNSTNRDTHCNPPQNTRASAINDQGSRDRNDRSGTGGGRGQHLFESSPKRHSQDTPSARTFKADEAVNAATQKEKESLKRSVSHRESLDLGSRFREPRYIDGDKYRKNGQNLQSSQYTTPSSTSHTKYSVSATSVDTSPHNECMHPMRRQYLAQHHAEENHKSPLNSYTERRLNQYTLSMNGSSPVSVTTTTSSAQDNTSTSKPRSLCPHSARRDSVSLTSLPRAGRAQDVSRDDSSTGERQLGSGVRELFPEHLQRRLRKEASVSGASDGDRDYTTPNKQGRHQADHPQFSAPEPRSDTRASKNASSRDSYTFDSAASSSLAKSHPSPSTNQNTTTKSFVPNLKCRCCNTNFLTRDAFNAHIRGPCSRTCQYCNRFVDVKTSFFEHKEYECPQTCRRCHKVMDGFEGLRIHLNENRQCRL